MLEKLPMPARIRHYCRFIGWAAIGTEQQGPYSWASCTATAHHGIAHQECRAMSSHTLGLQLLIPVSPRPPHAENDNFLPAASRPEEQSRGDGAQIARGSGKSTTSNHCLWSQSSKFRSKWGPPWTRDLANFARQARRERKKSNIHKSHK